MTAAKEPLQPECIALGEALRPIATKAEARQWLTLMRAFNLQSPFQRMA